MKPLGTITKYYPFIEDESKSILDSLMEDSSSYFDFVQKLCDFAFENEVPVNVAFIAAMQAWWTGIEDAMRRIQEKYKDVPCIRPWGFAHTSTFCDQERYHDAIVEAIDVLMSKSED